MKDVIEHVRDVIAEKREKMLHPDYAILTEVQSRVLAEMRAELNALYKQGVIDVGETLNNKYIQIK